MHELARLSEAERRRIVDDFLDDVLGDLDVDPALAERMRMARPDLPDDPSPEQVEAWIELAELVADPDFRRRIRAMSERGAADRAAAAPQADHATRRAPPRSSSSSVRARRSRPGSTRGPPRPSRSSTRSSRRSRAAHGRADDPAYRAWLAEMLATFTDARAERYWQLLAVINGWPLRPATVPAWEWLAAALDAG